MKKIKLLILGLLLGVGIQNSAAQSLDFGLKAGLNASNYKISGVETQNDQGYSVGVTLRAKLAFLTITPEVNYTRSKFTIDSPLVLGSSAAVTNHSVDMPIAAGITLFRLVTVEAGPRFSLYDEAKTEINGKKISLGPTSTDLGYLLGVKVTFAQFSVGARYNGQFKSYESNFNNHSLSGFDYKIRNNSYSIYVGIRM